MSIFDARHTFTIFDRYFVSNIGWGYFELKQLQLDYYPTDFEKVPFEKVFAYLKTYHMLDTNTIIKGQLGNYLVNEIKLSNYSQLDKTDLFLSIITFINKQRKPQNFSTEDERLNRFDNYFASFFPDIEHKINQLIKSDINVFILDLTNNEKDKLGEFPIYGYFQHYLIEYKNDNLCALINLGFD